MRNRTILAVVFALLAVVVGISGVQAEGPSTGRVGRSEVRFLEGMIDHHQMALDMASDCLKKALSDAVKKICQAVIADQTDEIKLMRGWLLSWYKIDYNPMPTSHMMDMMKSGSHGMMMGGQHMGSNSGGMGGMNMMPDDPPMMMGMMAGLNKLEGREYDLAWLEAMIDHHDDAVHMSERILKAAEHKELRDLAQRIIDAQSAEIKAMESLIAELAK